MGIIQDKFFKFGIPKFIIKWSRIDNYTDYIDYQSKIFTNSLSSYIFNNNIMNSFLLRLQKPMSILFDQFNVTKNFKNYIVHKYYYKHKD